MNPRFLSTGDLLFGRYQIQAQIGVGGYGVVYRAMQINTGQAVALKVLHGARIYDHLSAAREKERFYREMALVAELTHPNIVQLKDTGEFDGAPVMVMEFVEGQELEERLRDSGPLDFNLARRVITQVLEAVGTAHQRGIIHRDLKPANIMLCGNALRPVVKVLDFGIATLTEQPAEGWQRLTETGVVIGTAAYMAPEQLSQQLSSPRSDLYAIGLIFLECLTGQRAVQGATGVETAVKQITEPLYIPPEIRQSPFAHIIERACAKTPEGRYSTAEQMLADLDALAIPTHLSSGSTSPGAPASPNQAPTRQHRQRIALLAAITAVSLTLLALAFYALLRQPATTTPTAAPPPLTATCADRPITPTHHQHCTQACHLGDHWACARGAYLLLSGEGSHADLHAALALAQTGCQAQNAAACRLLALAYLQGTGTPVDYASARRILQQTLDAGDPFAAYPLALIEDQGKGQPRDEVRALNHFRQACSAAFAGDHLRAELDPMDQHLAGLACAHLASAGQDDLAHPPRQRALALLEAACQAGLAAACVDLAHLHASQDEGEDRALAIFAKGCAEAHLLACHELARIQLQRGDTATAIPLLDQACQGGWAPACTTAAQSLAGTEATPDDAARAAALLERACQGGDPEGCYRIALSARTPGASQPSPARAQQAALQGCKHGHGEACYALATFFQDGYTGAPDPTRAAEFFAAACQEREWAGCTALALLLDRALDDDDSREDVAGLYEMACDAGHRTGCFFLGILLVQGKGITPDVHRGKALLDGACKAGESEACRALDIIDEHLGP